MNKWAKIKIAVLVFIVVFTFIGGSELVGDEPPAFIYPLVAIIMFFGSIAYFKAASTRKKLTIGNMAAFSKSIFIDPLPFFHFVALVALISGISRMARDLIGNNPIDPYAFFSLAVGVGVFLGVIIGNNKFVVEQTPPKE